MRVRANGWCARIAISGRHLFPGVVVLVSVAVRAYRVVESLGDSRSRAGSAGWSWVGVRCRTGKQQCLSCGGVCQVAKQETEPSETP